MKPWIPNNDSYRNLSFCILPISVGMLPLKLHPGKLLAHTTGKFQEEGSTGRREGGPEGKSDESSYSVSSFCKFPMDEGIPPVRLMLKERSLRFLQISFGSKKILRSPPRGDGGVRRRAANLHELELCELADVVAQRSYEAHRHHRSETETNVHNISRIAEGDLESADQKRSLTM